MAHNRTTRNRSIRFFDDCFYAARRTFKEYIASQVSHSFSLSLQILARGKVTGELLHGVLA